jgi:hypothetical protein
MVLVLAMVLATNMGTAIQGTIMVTMVATNMPVTTELRTLITGNPKTSINIQNNLKHLVAYGLIHLSMKHPNMTPPAMIHPIMMYTKRKTYPTLKPWFQFLTIMTHPSLNFPSMKHPSLIHPSMTYPSLKPPSLKHISFDINKIALIPVLKSSLL